MRRLLAFLFVLPGIALASPGFNGTWCGNGPLQDFSLKIAAADTTNEVDGTLTRNGRSRPVHGSVDGNELRTQATRHGSLVLASLGNELRIVGGEGMLALLKGGTFRRAATGACAR